MIHYLYTTIVTSLLLAGGLAAVSREEVISRATHSSLDDLFQQSYHRALGMTAMTGRLNDVPFSQPSVYPPIQITGSTQEAVYGLHVSVPNARANYICFSDGGFILYNNQEIIAYQSDRNQSCGAAMNSGALSTKCRKNYRFQSQGKLKESGAVVSNANYDCTQRYWYKDAVTAGKPFWAALNTFSSPVATVPTATGVTLATPYYNGATVIGVTAVDLDYTFVEPLLEEFAKDGVIVYLADTKTTYLVAASSGEPPVVGGKMIYCKDAKNPIIAQSATYVTGGDTSGSVWAPDGSHFIYIDGVGHVVHIATVIDSETQSLKWKLITVGPEETLPRVDYQTPSGDALTYTVSEIVDTLSAVKTLPSLLTWMAGSYNDAPNSMNSVETTQDPTREGITQESLWVAFKMLNSTLNNKVVSLGVGYKQNGTYLGYSYGSDGRISYAFRNKDTLDGCTGIAEDCLQKFSVSSNGKPLSSTSNSSSFDPRLQTWWKNAQSTGSGAWSSLYYDASNVPVIAYAYSIYDKESELFVGEAAVEYRLVDLQNTLVKYNKGYTAYCYDSATGSMMANNVNAPNMQAASQSSDPVIQKSASYISSQSLYSSFTETVEYNATFDMLINAHLHSDALHTLSMYIVNVELVAVATSSTPTAMPVAEPVAASSQDDSVETAKEASVAAAVLAAILIVLVGALVYIVATKNAGSESKVLLSSSSHKEIAMSSSGPSV